MRKALGNHLRVNPDCNLSKREEDMLTGSEMSHFDVSLFRVTVWGEWYAAPSNLVQCRHTEIFFMQEKRARAACCWIQESRLLEKRAESCGCLSNTTRRFSQNRCPLGHFSL